MRTVSRWTGVAVVLALFLWSAWETELSLSRMVEGLPFMADFLQRMFPPDFSVLGNAGRGALQTLQIAVVGTAVAAVAALPLGFLAPRPGSFPGCPPCSTRSGPSTRSSTRSSSSRQWVLARFRACWPSWRTQIG